jgi:hypothetical protein
MDRHPRETGALTRSKFFAAVMGSASDDRNRSAAKGTGLAGCIGQNMAFLQRSGLARETAGLGLEVDPTVNVIDAALSAVVRKATAPP